MPTDWLHPALRFAQYALLLGLFGSLTFRLLGLRGLAAPPIATGSATRTAAMVAPFITVAVMLIGIADMMGQALWDLDRTTIASIVLTTDMGAAFLARVALLGAAAAVLALVKPATRSQAVAAWLCAVALLTLAWNGHAAVSEGWLGLVHRLNDWAHLMAAGIWMGAIGWFTLLILVAHREPARMPPAPLLRLMHRFRPVGVALVGVVALTGTINAHLIFGIANSFTMLQTRYGWLLAAKMLLVVLMLLCAARHALVGGQIAGKPEWDSSRTEATLAKLRRSLTAELVLAVGVLITVAFAGVAAPMPD